MNIDKIISQNIDTIYDRIGYEEVATYLFLKKEFNKGSILNNHLFKFVYKNYFRLENAGLRNEFKSRYFELLEENRHVKNFGSEKITKMLIQLSEFENRKGQKTIQFSFTSKMISIINEEKYPVYDKEVLRVFNMNAPYHIKSREKKIRKYLGQFDVIQEYYEQIQDTELGQRIFAKFQNKFQDLGAVSNMKQLDFVFWTTGKLIKEKKILH